MEQESLDSTRSGDCLKFFLSPGPLRGTLADPTPQDTCELQAQPSTTVAAPSPRDTHMIIISRISTTRPRQATSARTQSQPNSTQNNSQVRQSTADQRSYCGGQPVEDREGSAFGELSQEWSWGVRTNQCGCPLCGVSLFPATKEIDSTFKLMANVHWLAESPHAIRCPCRKSPLMSDHGLRRFLRATPLGLFPK
jgi:hypothetical protein